MYVSDEKFLFLHLHKCGGQYVARFLRSHFGTRLVGYHYPYSHIPLAKITLSVGLTALVGGGTYLIWRHLNANANLNNHDGDEQEAQQIPVGIHHLLNAAGEGKIILDSARRLAKLAE